MIATARHFRTHGPGWTTAWGLVLLMASACSSIQHDVPQTTAADEQAALAEIQAWSGPEQASSLSQEEARSRLDTVYRKIKPAAVEVCRYAAEVRACAWDVQYSELDETNAFATDGNRVVVFHGIIEATDSEDELAFVLAHELAHHIADHIDETGGRASTGMLITGLGLAALGSGVGCTSYACLYGVQNAAGAAMQAGGSIGVLMFSVEQEKEADYLAAHILGLAGYDLASSRMMIVKFGAKSGDVETGFLNSHPAGPERLASYQKTMELIREDSDGLPGEDPLARYRAQSESDSEQDAEAPRIMDVNDENFDPSVCRLYIPEDNVCIY